MVLAASGVITVGNVGLSRVIQKLERAYTLVSRTAAL